MNKEEKTIDAIILKQTDYKDNDAIISALGEDGNYYTFYARGIRKQTSRNAGALQTLTKSKISYFVNMKGMHLLKSAYYINSYTDQIEDYDKMICAFIIVEVVEKHARMLVNSELSLYELLSDSLKSLTKVNEYILLSSLFSNILILRGEALVCEACAVCQSNTINYISYNHGGFVCYDCLDDNDVLQNDVELLKLFRYVNKASISDLSKITYEDNTAKMLLEIMYYFYETYTGEYVKNINNFIEISHS